MFAVVATYPGGARVLVGYAHKKEDVDGLIADSISATGEEMIQAYGIRFKIEQVG